MLKQLLIDANLFTDYKPNTLRNIIESRPRMRPRTSLIKTELHGKFTTSGCLHNSISKDESFEKKLEFALKEIEIMNGIINKLDKNLNEMCKAVLNKTNELNINIEKVSNKLYSTIAGHVVGEYDKNLFGIVATICGTLIQIFKS